MAANDPPPSLQQVRDELDIEQASFRDRASSFDSKIGVLIAADGVLIVLRPAEQTPFDLLAALTAATSVLVLAWAHMPRVDAAVSPRALRDRYLMRPPDETRLRLLDTRIQILMDDEGALRRKAGRLRAGIALLACAVVLAAAGSIMMFIAR